MEVQDQDFPSMFGQSYHDESLRPPPDSGDAEGEEDSWDWGEALVDNAAYMINKRNHTFAQCPVIKKGRDGGKKDMLQVTFCLAQPPHISYFCMSYHSGEPTQFRYEPRILATEGNLAVVGLMHGRTLHNEPSSYINLVYRAPILAHESPNLRRLPHPSTEVFPDNTECYLPHGQVGILRYRTRSGSKQQTFTPPTPTLTHAPESALARRHKSPFIPNTNSDDYDAFKIATLCSRWESGTKQYDLCIYDSKADAWTRKPTAFSQPQGAPRKHLCDRVITIGGKMGWVDLWRGILLCDVHVHGEEESRAPRLLHYIPLPEPRQPVNDLPLFGFSSFFRDIVVIKDRIKFVDLQIHASSGSLTPNGWTAVTWSMAVGDSVFHEDSVLNSGDIVNALEPSLFVAHPKLSSHDDDILYLMTKASLDDRVTRVIAVNMKKKKLERTAKFTIQREACTDFAYIRTTISNYLSPDPQGKTKRRGPLLQESSRKKPSQDLPPMGDEGDNMDLE